jgi:hypothetical protein
MVDNKKRLYWILQGSGWTVYTLLQTLFSTMAIQQALTLRRISFFVAEAVICLLLTHAYRFYIKKQRWVGMPMPRLLPRILLGIALLGMATYAVRIPVGIVLGRANPLANPVDVPQTMGLIGVYMLIFFLWSLVYFTYHYLEQYNKSLKHEASRMEIELNNLKSQLNPHFIFNALNSIRALVDENPGKSKQAINQLSNILRNSLTFDKKGLTKFEDELKVVKDYLSLEGIRFEERLKTEFDIHPDSHEYLVPPFMIQTLVENGVKHGISRLKSGGTIQVKTTVENQHLTIRIRNSGQLATSSRKTSGLGLANTAQRLRILYGDDASFTIVNESPNFVLTEVTLPQPPRT